MAAKGLALEFSKKLAIMLAPFEYHHTTVSNFS